MGPAPLGDRVSSSAAASIGSRGCRCWHAYTAATGHLVHRRPHPPHMTCGLRSARLDAGRRRGTPIDPKRDRGVDRAHSAAERRPAAAMSKARQPSSLTVCGSGTLRGWRANERGRQREAGRGGANGPSSEREGYGGVDQCQRTCTSSEAQHQSPAWRGNAILLYSAVRVILRVILRVALRVALSAALSAAATRTE